MRFSIGSFRARDAWTALSRDVFRARAYQLTSRSALLSFRRWQLKKITNNNYWLFIPFLVVLQAKHLTSLFFCFFSHQEETGILHVRDARGGVLRSTPGCLGVSLRFALLRLGKNMLVAAIMKPMFKKESVHI